MDRCSSAFMRLMSSREPQQLQLTEEMMDDRRTDKKPHQLQQQSAKRQH